MSLLNRRVKLVYRDGSVVRDKVCVGTIVADELHLITIRFDDGEEKIIGKGAVVSITPLEVSNG